MALASVSHINGLPKPEVSIAETASRAWLCERPTSSTSDETESAPGTCVRIRFTCDYIQRRVGERFARKKLGYRARTAIGLCRHSSLFLSVISTLTSRSVCRVHLNLQLISSHR